MLIVRGISVSFPSAGGGLIHAADGVSLDVGAGEIVGLVGEA